jgi:hypothetical protein
VLELQRVASSFRSSSSSRTGQPAQEPDEPPAAGRPDRAARPPSRDTGWSGGTGEAIRAHTGRSR